MKKIALVGSFFVKNIRKVIILLSIGILFLVLNQGVCESIGENSEPGIFKIENRFILLKYDSVHNSFEIKNQKTGNIYRTLPLSSYDTSSVSIKSNLNMEISIDLHKTEGGLPILVKIALEDNKIKCVMEADKNAFMTQPVTFPGAFTGEEENQHFAIPYGEGIYVPATEKCDFGDYEMWGHKSTMPFIGMTDSKTGIMITSETPCDTAIEFVRNDFFDKGNYLMELTHYPSKGKFEYNRIFYIDLINKDGYNEMAAIYRKHLEKEELLKGQNGRDVLITLREKLKKNKNVDKFIGSVDFWLGPDEMKNTQIIDELKENGIKKAIINFQYGWKVFDNERRPDVVQYAAQNGMLPSRYDNFTDIFDKDAEKISQRYRTDGFENRVIIKENGDAQEGYKSFYNGGFVQGYIMNSKLSDEDVDSFLENDLKENNYLGRFVDVAVSCRLYEDFSKNHSMNREQDLENRYELLNKISSGYNMITGTEETSYWAVPVTHYSEGTLSIVPPDGSGDDWSTPTGEPGDLYLKYTVNPAVRIPLKSLVYHDCHVSGWYTGDGVSKVIPYWRTKDLLTILYGAINLVFPNDMTFWENYKDKFIWSIKASGWVFEKVGYERMEKHEFLSSDRLVQRTTFSNGMKIIVNFSDDSFNIGSINIPAKDFAVVKGCKVYTSEMIIKDYMH